MEMKEYITAITAVRGQEHIQLLMLYHCNQPDTLLLVIVLGVLLFLGMGIVEAEEIYSIVIMVLHGTYPI
jgi:hypothetical protein